MGEIVAIAAKGKVMGNRGPLLDMNGAHARDWAYRRWICCHIAEVHDRRVCFDDPEKYTPLFMTDEAVALAAGHRPCGSCRPEAYYHWLAIWKYLTGTSKFERVKASVMDRDLHRRRLAAFSKAGRSLRLEDVPDGTFVIANSLSAHPLLRWRGSLWPWKNGEYGLPLPIGGTEMQLDVFPRFGIRFLMCGFAFDPELGPDFGI